MRVPWRGTSRPPAALDDRRCQDAWRRRRISHTGGFDPENSTIMHDWTRFGRARGTVASGKRRAGERARPCHFLPLFAISSQKIFFFTFIDLYPPLSTFIGMVWRRRTGGAGARPDGSDRAPFWRKTPRSAADGMPSRPLLTFVARNLMLLSSVSHSEGIVNANLEESAGADERGL